MKNFPEHYKELSTWMEKLGVAIPGAMQCKALVLCMKQRLSREH